LADAQFKIYFILNIKFFFYNLIKVNSGDKMRIWFVFAWVLLWGVPAATGGGGSPPEVARDSAEEVHPASWWGRFSGACTDLLDKLGGFSEGKEEGPEADPSLELLQEAAKEALRLGGAAENFVRGSMKGSLYLWNSLPPQVKLLLLARGASSATTSALAVWGMDQCLPEDALTGLTPIPDQCWVGEAPIPPQCSLPPFDLPEDLEGFRSLIMSCFGFPVGGEARVPNDYQMFQCNNRGATLLDICLGRWWRLTMKNGVLNVQEREGSEFVRTMVCDAWMRMTSLPWFVRLYSFLPGVAPDCRF
jgi:hypothetical protein